MTGKADKPALQLTPARFPGRAPIEAYGNGGFRFAGMSHRGSILALPDAIQAWPPVAGAMLTISDFAPLIERAATIDVLIVGTGNTLIWPAPETRRAFEEAGLFPEFMSTGAAVRTFNVLLSEDRAVAAALIAVNDA